MGPGVNFEQTKKMIFLKKKSCVFDFWGVFLGPLKFAKSFSCRPARPLRPWCSFFPAKLHQQPLGIGSRVNCDQEIFFGFLKEKMGFVPDGSRGVYSRPNCTGDVQSGKILKKLKSFQKIAQNSSQEPF